MSSNSPASPLTSEPRPGLARSFVPRGSPRSTDDGYVHMTAARDGSHREKGVRQHGDMHATGTRVFRSRKSSSTRICSQTWQYVQYMHDLHYPPRGNAKLQAAWLFPGPEDGTVSGYIHYGLGGQQERDGQGGGQCWSCCSPPSEKIRT